MDHFNTLKDVIPFAYKYVTNQDGSWVQKSSRQSWGDEQFFSPIEWVIEDACTEHDGVPLVFDDQENIDRFLTTNSKNLEPLQKYVRLLRSHEQGLVVTLDQVLEAARASVHLYEPDMQRKNRASQIFEGKCERVDRTAAVATLLSNATLNQRKYCINEIARGGVEAYRLLQDTVFEHEIRQLSEGTQIDSIEPQRAWLETSTNSISWPGRPFIGSMFIIPDNPKQVPWYDYQPYHGGRTAGSKTNATIYGRAGTNQDSRSYRCSCRSQGFNAIAPAARTLPFDIIQAR